ncbi:hypothetical protein B0G57_1053 [Trinickia symbiotica]|nr:hypothetical protein [Trinickia symbiotica]PPK45297.1 hypothetical protein B0G57_1053 [Trinickia symbiotica]
MKGRRGDRFFHALAEEPIELQIDVIRRIGFRAIYIDRQGYADNGAAIEARLTRDLGEPPVLISNNGNQVLFDLRPLSTATPLPAGLRPDQIMERAQFVVDDQGVRDDSTLPERIDFSRNPFPDFIANARGLSGCESWGRWSDANVFPYVELKFRQPLPRHFVLHLRLQAFGPNEGKPVRVLAGAQEKTFIPASTRGRYSLYFDNSAASRTIQIVPPQPISPQELHMGSDARRLGLGFQSLSIEAIR